jgi:hypothetical protein
LKGVGSRLAERKLSATPIAASAEEAQNCNAKPISWVEPLSRLPDLAIAEALLQDILTGGTGSRRTS